MKENYSEQKIQSIFRIIENISERVEDLNGRISSLTKLYTLENEKIEQKLLNKYDAVILQYEQLIREREENDKVWQERKKILNYVFGR